MNISSPLRLIFKSVSVALLFTLMACSQVTKKTPPPPGAYPTPAPGAAQGAAVGSFLGISIAGFSSNALFPTILGGALFGAPIGSARDLQGAIDQLASEGITIILLGDIVEVVIPDDLVFDPETYDLTLKGQVLLAQVSNFLAQYAQAHMTIIGHSDNIGSDREQAQRSKRQAQAIMAFIWSHGVPISQLSFAGVGPSEPTASMKYANGQAYNRRVVLVFWKQGTVYDKLLLNLQQPDCWTSADPTNCMIAQTES